MAAVCKKEKAVCKSAFARFAAKNTAAAPANPTYKPYTAPKTKNRSSFEKRSFGLSDRI